MALLSQLLQPFAYVSLPLFVLHQVSTHSSIARYYIRLALYLSTLGTCSVWGVILSIVMSLAGRRFDINYVVARSFYFLAGRALDIKFEVEGEEHLRDTCPAVIVGNHQSMLDILYIGRIMPKRASILAKRELKWTPLLGQFMTLSGAVFVDRASNQDAVKSLREAGETMKKQRTSIWMFPEGTRHLQEQVDLLPFKKGAFHVAIHAGIPIVPIVCENYWRLYRKGVFESGILRIRVLPPIQTKGLGTTDVSDLAARTRDVMLTALREVSTAKTRSSVRSAPTAHTSSTPTPRESSPAGVAAGSSPVVRELPASRLEEIAAEPAVGSVTESRSETSSVSGDHTEEDEGMVLVGRPA